MRATIDRKTYDTETATEIASDSDGYRNDFNHWEETLYVTKKGSYFLHGEGGALSRYAQSCEGGRASCGSSAIIPLTEAEALEWCEVHQCQDAIDEHFQQLTEEA
jgi:hypothetical protein